MGNVGSVKRKGSTRDAKIESKDQRWHCRNRITLVFGSNDLEELDTYIYKKNMVEFKTVQFHQSKSKAIEEILDNSIDEYYRSNVTEIHVDLASDYKTVTIEDNGIGIPLNKVEQVYKEFRTGSKFHDEEVDSKGFLYRTLGQNGLGASATCLTSDLFEVRVRHYNSKKEQTYTFIDGALKIKKTKPKIFRGHSGVRIKLQLSKEVYKDEVIDEQLLRKRVIDLAYTHPGLIFYFNKEKYIFEKGLFELAQLVDRKNSQLLGDDTYKYETKTSKGRKVKGRVDIHTSICIDNRSEERERFISFVNSTPTFDGGFHRDRIKRLFINYIKAKLEKITKKEKLSIVDNDILIGTTFIIGITMPNPRFESQTKRKLVRDIHLESSIEKFMRKYMKMFLVNNKNFLDMILERARNRHKFQVLKDASKKGKKQKKQRVEKLLDANERKDRSKCTLFICEGESAIGGLRSARNKETQGGIALKGKPMNVSQASLKDILNNQEFSNIMAAIGLVLGADVDFNNLHYYRIVFLSDSDIDGGHINTLLTNFFFTFWPKLFQKKMIEIVKAPLFEIITDSGIVFIESNAKFEEFKKKNSKKIKAIHRNKGLGEMSTDAWKHVLKRESYTTINIDDAKNSKNILNVCFGKDTSLRKDLLVEENSKTKRKKATKKKVSKI